MPSSKAQTGAAQTPEAPEALFAVYVHWPYCLSKCPYCDFNSHVAGQVDHALWRRAFEQDIAAIAAFAPGRVVTSVFFGGGTPSLMEPETVDAVLAAIARHWTFAHDAEITLEANPTSVESEKFRAFAQAGINRVSLGVQALNDRDLAFLGRTHGAAEACRAIDIAQACFDRSSFDLIYARPGQTPETWENELDCALSLAAGHLSLYQLTIEQGTRFAAMHRRGEFATPGEDMAAALYECTQAFLSGAGMPAYEISNHARPGQESLHNLTYWRYGDYAGTGPGAHGRLTVNGTRLATRGHRAPDIWLERALKTGSGLHPHETIAPDGQLSELMMMGLRLAEGVPLARIESVTGQAWDRALPAERIETLCAEGFLQKEAGRIRATPGGLQRLDSLLGFLLG